MPHQVVLAAADGSAAAIAIAIHKAFVAHTIGSALAAAGSAPAPTASSGRRISRHNPPAHHGPARRSVHRLGPPDMLERHVVDGDEAFQHQAFIDQLRIAAPSLKIADRASTHGRQRPVPRRR